MFRLETSRPDPLRGTLIFYKDPTWFGPGYYTDVFGETWDCRVCGMNRSGKWVSATHINPNSYFHSTLLSSFFSGLQSMTWYPYRVEVVGRNYIPDITTA